MEYYKNYEENFWEGILGRKLNDEETKLFTMIKSEIKLNINTKILQTKLIQSRLYIKAQTSNFGNCLFESLGHLGLGVNSYGFEPHIMIRGGLAKILSHVKNIKGFFPSHPHLSPLDIFLLINDIDMILVNDIPTVYDYDLMVWDLNIEYSWRRLPTEFILLAISRIYQVHILIYNNNSDYVHSINVFGEVGEVQDKQTQIIRLGQINEEHYYPLFEIYKGIELTSDIINQILENDIKYDKYTKEFDVWSESVVKSLCQICYNNI